MCYHLVGLNIMVSAERVELFREEFYAKPSFAESVGAFKYELDKAVEKI